MNTKTARFSLNTKSLTEQGSGPRVLLPYEAALRVSRREELASMREVCRAIVVALAVIHLVAMAFGRPLVEHVASVAGWILMLWFVGPYLLVAMASKTDLNERMNPRLEVNAKQMAAMIGWANAYPTVAAAMAQWCKDPSPLSVFHYHLCRREALNQQVGHEHQRNSERVRALRQQWEATEVA